VPDPVNFAHVKRKNLPFLLVHSGEQSGHGLALVNKFIVLEVVVDDLDFLHSLHHLDDLLGLLLLFRISDQRQAVRILKKVDW
jgi:hypothetical protein